MPQCVIFEHVFFTNDASFYPDTQSDPVLHVYYLEGDLLVVVSSSLLNEHKSALTCFILFGLLVVVCKSDGIPK